MTPVLLAVTAVSLGLATAAVVVLVRARGGAAPSAQAPDVGPGVSYHAALDALPLGVVVRDGQGQTVYTNPVAEGFSTRHHGSALIEAGVERVIAAAVPGVPACDTIDLFKPPRRSYELTALRLDDSSDRATMAIVEDVTERRRVEEMRRDFVANISHELKTPVGAIALLADTLLDEDDTTVGRRLVERMLEEAERMGRTIDDLLMLSRLEAEDLGEREELPVHLIVAEAAGRIRPAAEQRGVALSIDEPDDRMLVVGDRRQLVSAVANLVDNAVKYSESDSEVRVRAVTDGRSVSIEVSDRGIGIPVPDLDRIFERFYRVDRGRSRQTGGTGLGLSIVRHVARNHAGKVEVESVFGEGSTFLLAIPLLDAGPIGVTAEAS